MLVQQLILLLGINLQIPGNYTVALLSLANLLTNFSPTQYFTTNKSFQTSNTSGRGKKVHLIINH